MAWTFHRRNLLSNQPDFLPFAFLPVLKPVGPTSHDVVGRVRRLLPRKTRVGHTGTLDPFASGVMILGIGKATRFADDVHLLPKSYRGVIRLGEETDTLDLTGEVVKTIPVPSFSDEDLDALAARFSGEQDQMPPAYSAKKVGGKRAYELARNNQKVELKTRRITIHASKLSRQDDNHLIYDVTCSTGTYIRSLARDIGEAMGTCGHLTSLVRTEVGPLTKDKCVEMDALTAENLKNYLIPISNLLPHIEALQIGMDISQYLAQGRAWPSDEPYPEDFLATYRDDAGVIQHIFRCSYDSENKVIRSKMMCYERPRE